jgi:hypothetical protein
MPIEIRELIIRSVVNSADEKPTSKANSAKTASNNGIIQGLEKAIELIKNKNER